MSTSLGMRMLTRCHRAPPPALLLASAQQPSRATNRVQQPSNRRNIFGLAESATYAGALLSKKIVLGTIGLNVAVFGAWQYAASSSRPGDVWQGGSSPRSGAAQVGRALENNFLLHGDDLKRGRFWTTLTSAFSHQQLFHIFGNMMSFYAFSSVIAMGGGLCVTPQALATIMVGSALSGSIAFLLNSRQGLGGQSSFRFGQTAALGASGMVMGVGACAALLRPYASMMIMPIPVPIPMWAIYLGYLAWDSYNLHNPTSLVGHSAHLGGAMFGTAFYFLFLRRLGGMFPL